MAIRKIEVLLDREAEERFLEFLHEGDDCPSIRFWTQPAAEGKCLGSILVRAEDSEAALDFLQTQFGSGDEPRILVLPVEATLPRLDPKEDEQEPVRAPSPEPARKTVQRISREELYADLEQTSRFNSTFLVLVTLAAVVAAIGILRDDVAVVVGAMVIAPLLGPNVALSLATTLGDLKFARRALTVGGAGLSLALILALGMGLVLEVDPNNSQIASRTQPGPIDIILALSAGTAGALSFTVGIPAAVVGVMVAVALLPPLVVFGMLAGSGHWKLALGAVLLTLTNLICVNLAGVVTFLVQGVRPHTWWEQDEARRATRIAIGSWLLMLVLLAIIMLIVY